MRVSEGAGAGAAEPNAAAEKYVKIKQVVRQDENRFVPMCANASPCSQAGVVLTAVTKRSAAILRVRQAGAVQLAPFSDSPFYNRPPIIPHGQIAPHQKHLVLRFSALSVTTNPSLMQALY